MMEDHCMGGGVAFKRPVQAPSALLTSVKTTGRNYDEVVLWRLIEQVAPLERRLNYRTRMTDNGVYHFYSDESVRKLQKQT